MKKLFVLTVLLIAVAGFAAAGGLDFHLGAGWHSSFFGDIDGIDNFSPSLSKAKAMPLGIGGYVGLGYGFGKQLLNLGIEFAPSWDFSLAGYKVTNLALQGRAYLKFKFADILTAAAFGGYTLNLAGSTDDPGSLVGTPVVGARVTVLFIYAEYGMNLRPSFDGIAKHEVGLGVAIFR